MLHLLALSLIVTPIPAGLTPEAGEHNATAMRHYDAGQLAQAVDEFHAAYTSMPDARRDRVGREMLLGSMRSTLLTIHAASGEPAPLCRLQQILKAHVDALALAHPDDPDLLETRSARAHHAEVTTDLAALGPDACEPPPATTPPPTASTATPAQRTQGQARRPSLHILRGRRVAATARRRPRRPPPRHRHRRRGAVTTAFGVTLFALARRSARANRWSAAPWWSTSGAGLTLHVQLGATRHLARETSPRSSPRSP